MRDKSRMRADKDERNVPLEADQDFPRFLKQVRKEEKVLLEQLADGLMTASQLARIEKRQRPVHKNMRDRLLGRLGVARDMYENLLNIEDHAAWECERNILCAVERCESQRAQKLIAEYEKREPAGDKIKLQFCLVMTAEVMKQQKADRQEIGACYEKAVKLTVPDVKYLRIKKKLLSIQEINMILEYEFYHINEHFEEKYKDLMAFVENSAYDNLSKVKVYPKIVFYYLQGIFERKSEQTADSMRESLQLCDRAVEMLRDTGRAYYLLELMEMKIKILTYLERSLDESGDLRELEEMKAACVESTELANLLKNSIQSMMYLRICRTVLICTGSDGCSMSAMSCGYAGKCMASRRKNCARESVRSGHCAGRRKGKRTCSRSSWACCCESLACPKSSREHAL